MSVEGVSKAAIPTALTTDDYARAERFLPWNKDRYVVNLDIQHHWIGNEDRFWYLRTNAAGGREFVVVDAANVNQTPAFDHKKIADALSTRTGQAIEAGKLPFSKFRYVQGKTAIQFHYAGMSWTLELSRSTCVAVPPSVGANEIMSPDGKWVVFLKDRNVWIRPTSGDAAFPLTTDGIEHYSYGDFPGHQSKPRPAQVIWSPNSHYLLTYRLDERKVRDLFLIQSVPEDGSLRPKLHTYRYAMPGDEHVLQVEPLIFDVIARRQLNLAMLPMIGSVVTLIQGHQMWWSADSRAIYYLDRDRFSKSIALRRADLATGAVSEVLRETSPTVVQVTAGIVCDFPVIRTLKNGDVIWYSQRDGWGHLYYYEGAGVLRNQITRGDWVVRSLVRVDEANQRIFFMASGREGGRDPYEQRLYSIKFDGSGIRLLTPEEGEHEPYVPSLVRSLSLDETLPIELEVAERGAFSPSGRYFVDSYSRPDVPPVLVLRTAEGELIQRLEQADISKLRAGGYVSIEPFQVLAADGKTPIFGNLFRPSTFDPARKYPVIDAIYPGPQIIRARKSFALALFDDFEAQSLAELGFIVITIDGRGTPQRSKAFLDYSYGRLDKASELEDHIAGIRQLAQRYPYMDLDRVGIDGVSGGGYAAAHALLAYPDFYKVAVSAEGNHDQRGNTAAWGETYIGPFRERDYEVASTPRLAANLRGKLLLMHGEMDDNVSPTLTMRLVDSLIKANKDFDLLILPNGSHLAYTSPYFIRRKWDYFVHHLLGTEPPAAYSICQPS